MSKSAYPLILFSGIVALYLLHLAVTWRALPPIETIPAPHVVAQASPQVITVNAVLHIDTPTPTTEPTQGPTKTPPPTVNYCGSWTKDGEICTKAYTVATSTPVKSCDDQEVIGGMDCVYRVASTVTPIPTIQEVFP